ncbi:unnamed protein product [Plutella xylostella]|uniref:(diamondback moth) hypothetical protein n=1 Tax=Plutella xylostella TaxID=51655 RepID=A0A8S4DBW7_PLUXY|nr:unnamed protein product [Plutella xylostella]
MSYITPGHFLTGATLSTVPEPNISNIPINRLKFWKQCSHMTQCFWKSWSREYLMQLQSRPKWRKPLPNISKGMLVILRIDNAPPLVWPMARVVETFPGADGKSESLMQAAFDGPWLRCGRRAARCVLLVAERSRRPLAVTAGKIFPLSLHTYTVVQSQQSHSLSSRCTPTTTT